MRVGGNFSSAVQIAQNNLSNISSQMARASLRLATAKRINRGSDDPAGLIAVSQLQRELSDLEGLSDSADRARGLAQVADSGLSEVSQLLNRVRANVVEAASTTSAEQQDALQLEVDAALDAINLIRNTTKISGQRVLDGGTTIRVGSSGGPSFSVPEVSSASLGGDAGVLNDLRSNGSASLTNDTTLAFQIVEQAQESVAVARGELGSFVRTTIDSTKEITSRISENVIQAKSQIEDADFSREVGNLVRSEIFGKIGVLAFRATLDAEDSMRGLLFDTVR